MLIQTILKRLAAIVAAAFILVVLIVAFAPGALFYLASGKDITSKLEKWLRSLA